MSEPAENIGARRVGKSETAFRTIGEVADDLDVPAHVLRFWELKFAQLKPLKRGGGRRYYRPEDIQLLRRIRQCLYQEGYTIRGVQKLLDGAAAENGGPGLDATAPSLFPLEAEARSKTASATQRAGRRVMRRETRLRDNQPDIRAALEELRRELLEVRSLLAALTGKPGSGSE